MFFNRKSKSIDGYINTYINTYINMNNPKINKRVV